MSRRPPPNERRSLLLGGPDSWRRVVLYGILAGVVLAVIAAVVAALIAGSEREPLDPPQTPTSPAVWREIDGLVLGVVGRDQLTQPFQRVSVQGGRGLGYL